MRISGNRAVQGQILSCRCSFLGHAEQPTPSHRREHVSAASAQVNGLIVPSVGKVVQQPLIEKILQLGQRPRAGHVGAAQRRVRPGALVTRRISRDLVPVEVSVSASMTSRAAATSRASARPVASRARTAR